MPNGKYVNLQETFKEVDEDNDGVFYEDILITNEDIGRENEKHVIDEDEEENQVDEEMSAQDSNLAGNANDYDDVLSP
jgi:hypothetical protein